MSKLYVVATPIGNLQDITLRALEVLKSVDAILAEDTRVTKKLLARFEIKKSVFAFHEYSSPAALEKITTLLESGKDLALVTDAGTPGLSDPGQRLISLLVHQFASFKPENQQTSKLEIIAIPGSSALLALISVSNIDCSEFLFLGFPPHKKGRKTFFERVSKNEVPVILFESPHRIIKTLKELEAACGDRYCNVGRELTKVYEEIGTIIEKN